MHIKPIHTEQGYQQALKRVDELMDADFGTKEGDELEVLSILVDAYEEKLFPIEEPDPIEAIKFRMEQAGLTNKDLERVMHSRRGRVSEVLNKRRPLTLDMIRKLNRGMHIPSEVLIQEYALKKIPLKRGKVL